MSLSPLPISKLAWFAADPGSFGRTPDDGERAAMRYGVDWHDSLGRATAPRRGRTIVVLIVIALVVLLILSAA